MNHSSQRDGACAGSVSLCCEAATQPAEILDYALTPLDTCPFQEGKTTYAKCPVHCYKPDMRENIRVVMRHSGPRMLYRHPALALLHVVHGRSKKPLRWSEHPSSD